MKDTELVLRYLALREVANRYDALNWDREAPRQQLDEKAEASPEEKRGVYRAPLNQFLNSYLESLGDDGSPERDAVAAFTRACKVLGPIGRSALRLDDSGQVNAAHADAVLVGLSMSSRVADESADLSSESLQADVRARLAGLEELDEYQTAVRESTSHLASVHKRLQLAVAAFRDV